MLTQKYSVEEFEKIVDQQPDQLLELIHGEIVEKVPTPEHAVIAAAIATFLNNHVMENRLGIVGVEGRHQIGSDNSRLPDVSFKANLNRPLPSKKFPYMPDLAVEIKSPDDSYTFMREKAAYYLQNGTQIVWLIYPEKQLVEVYRQNADSELLNIEDTLDGGDLLPGFTLPVRKIFQQE